ncbi:MAG: tetratricopeptide repeat protein, partial [Singulisphaera sp.]
MVDVFWHARVIQEAEREVVPRMSRGMLRTEVIEAIRADAALSKPVREEALALAGRIPDPFYARLLNSASSRDRNRPGADRAAWQRSLHLSEEACRLVPDRPSYLFDLGVAQYRLGRNREAIKTLDRALHLEPPQTSADRTRIQGGVSISIAERLACLAMAQYRLGRIEEARATLGRMRGVMRGVTTRLP